MSKPCHMYASIAYEWGKHRYGIFSARVDNRIQVILITKT